MKDDVILQPVPSAAIQPACSNRWAARVSIPEGWGEAEGRSQPTVIHQRQSAEEAPSRAIRPRSAAVNGKASIVRLSISDRNDSL